MPTPSGDTGGTAAGFVLALLVVVAIATAAFFYFGGEADVNVDAPTVEVSSSPAN